MAEEIKQTVGPYPDDPWTFHARIMCAAVLAKQEAHKIAAPLNLDVPGRHQNRKAMLQPDGKICFVKKRFDLTP